LEKITSLFSHRQETNYISIATKRLSGPQIAQG
jgi:hypothetical protein